MLRNTSYRRLTSLRLLSRPSCQFSSSSISLDKIIFRIDAQGTGVAQTAKVKGSPHEIYTDAYPSFGGKDSAPSPLAYALNSLSACTQVTGSLVAKELGIKLGDWRVTVKGILDTDVLVDGKQGNANWDNVELQVHVRTDTQQEVKFKQFSSETERRCPISQLFIRSGTRWKSQWVNDVL